MIREMSRCPYCGTHIALDWRTKTVVFNPDTGYPVCDHVVWVDGVLRLWPQANVQSRTNFRWAHLVFSSELRHNARLGEFLFDIEMGAIVELDAEWKCDLPTIRDPVGLLDAFVVYAANPEVCLVELLLDMKRSPRPQHRGPIADWWCPGSLETSCR